jgi:hypothetical protein
VILYPDLASNTITARDALGTWGSLAPQAIVAVIAVGGFLFFKRQEPLFAERV